MHPLLHRCFSLLLGFRASNRFGPRVASLCRGLAILTVAFSASAWADPGSPQFASQISVHGTTYSITESLEENGSHTDNYAAIISGTAYWLSATGPISAPVASVSGVGPEGEFVGFFDGTYVDAAVVASIATLSQTINGHLYTGTTRTTNTSIGSDNSLQSSTDDVYQGENGAITISTSNAGEVSVSGAESGFVANGAWYINSVVPTSAPFGPVNFFGKIYAFHHGSSQTTYLFDGTNVISEYSEDDVFVETGSDASASFVVHIVAPSTASGFIEGNDPALGSFTASVNGGIVGEVTATRTAPSFAPTQLSHSSTPVTWREGSAFGSGEIVDFYADSEYAITLTISGNPGNFQPGGSKIAQVSVAQGVAGSPQNGTYDGKTGLFAVTGFALQASAGNRNLPGAKYWVNGAEYLWKYGFMAANGSGADRFENPSMGGLTLSWNAAGVRSVDVFYDDCRYWGPYHAAVPLPAGGIQIEILEQLPQVDGAPPAFWVNGLLYWRTSPSSQTYGSSSEANDPNVIVITGSAAQYVLHVYGPLALQGSYDGSPGAFSLSDAGGTTRPAYPANLDGSAQLAAVPPPAGFPPAIYLSNAGTLQYLGTRAGGNACYGYAGPLYSDYFKAKLMTLEINPAGEVTLTGRLSVGSLEKGLYHSTYHLFQAASVQPLGMPVYGVDPLRNNTVWGLVAAPIGRPPTIVIDNKVWRYVGLIGDKQTYWGYQSGQVITIKAPASDLAAFLSAAVDVFEFGVRTRFGTYQPSSGTFLVADGAALLAGNAAGRAVAAPGRAITAAGAAQLQTISGDLDITGSILSLGAWGNNPAMAGLTLHYADTPSSASIGLTGSRPNTSFRFSEGTALTATTLRSKMLLDGNNWLTLFDPLPTIPAEPKDIVLRPGGVSAFKGGLRVPEQGDISMGGFMEGPMP